MDTARSSDPYGGDLGPDDADITSHDAFVAGVPHATFARLRGADPVSWHEEADGRGFWAVTRCADVLRVSHDVSTFTSTRGVRLEDMDDDQIEARRSLQECDPPEHTRLRRLVNRGFTRRTVAAYEATLRTLAGEVIAEAVDGDRIDFVHDIAAQLPMAMLGRLLGTDDADAPQLIRWADAMLGNTDPEFTSHPVDLADTEQYRHLPFRSPATLEVFEYAARLAADRRARPRDDITTRLLAPTVDGEPLSDLEFRNFFALLLAAGNDTTRYTIAHGLWVLLGQRHLWDRWKQQPELTPTAVEEMLRTGSVVMHFRRTATRDVELGERLVRAGDKVVIWYVSANHDDAVFADPYVFDLTREPNDHVAFGRNSPHLCLGAWLARLEIAVVFEELMARVDRVEQGGTVERLRSNFISGIKHLPVEVHP